MTRRAHYLKENRGSAIPARVLVVDTETEPRRVGPDVVDHHLTFGWCAFVRWRDLGGWSRPQWHRFTTPDDWTDILKTYIEPKTRLLIISHNSQYDAMILDAFNLLPKMGLELKRAIIACPPFCCDWRGKMGSVRWIDTLNYYTMSLRAIGDYFNLPKLDFPPNWNDAEIGDAYCRRDCEITLLAYQKWIAFVQAHDLGVLALSRAGQSFNAFRHRFMSHRILIDTHERALTLARSGYYGGRVDCFKIGKFSGPLYKLDINSMYPALMAQHTYPTKLLTYVSTPTIPELLRWMKTYLVVADVLLRATVPAYPYRAKHSLLFPTGTFRTVLTTPELLHAAQAGAIEAVITVSVYEHEPIFTQFVDYFYDQRMLAKQDNDRVLELNIKLLMNSLYGKFGQKGIVFKEAGSDPDNRLGYDYEIDYETKQITKHRYLGGLHQIEADQIEGSESSPAIAAHVTAYGRLFLWGLIDQAGIENCYYCDTDSIIVSEPGLEHLTHLIDNTQLGMLKLEQTIDHLDVRGPKDYQADGEIHIKGIRKDAVWRNDNTAIQEKWYGIKSMMRTGNVSRPRVEMAPKVLSRVYKKGHVLPSGDVLPFRFPADLPLLA